MSRLLDNSENLRRQIKARNLYTPNNPYEIDNPALVDTVNTIADIISPFSGFDLTNTVIGRIVGTLGGNTPIAQIGLQQLGIAFARTVASNAAQEFLPSISFNNLFDGDPDTKLFTSKIDFQITRRESQSNFSRLLESLIEARPFPQYPFNKNSTVFDYISNSGIGQLNQLSLNINRNIYRNTSFNFVTGFEGEGYSYIRVQNLLEGKEGTNGEPKIYFPAFDPINFPLSDIGNTNIRRSISQLFDTLSSSERNYFEYGGNTAFIEALGETSNIPESSFSLSPNDDPQVNVFDYGLRDENQDKVVWGVTGTDPAYVDNATQYGRERDGIFEGEVDPPTFPIDNNFNFNIRTGLLKYTQEFINATGGKNYIDQTKKRFVSQDKTKEYFRGSPLTREVDGTINRSRQHNRVDQYDRFSKAIRFEGNIKYGGNENSTIHRSVIPKFHPVLDENNTINNENMMFSIENLAYLLNEEGNMGDEFNTTLPKCEVGPNLGRLMWFAPYDIVLSESAIARHETTNFLGRSEPIYTYSNSERLANLSFKLLIDHPPQVRGRNHANASQFFAFGDRGYIEPIQDAKDIDKQIEDKENELNQIQPTKRQENVSIRASSLTIYFPNDYPLGTINSGSSAAIQNVETVIANMFDNQSSNIFGYQDGVSQPNEPTDYGFNEDAKSLIDTAIERYLNPDVIDQIKINIEAGTTKLYNENPNGIGPTRASYNVSLGIRRQQAILAYLNQKYKEIHNSTKTLSQQGVQINIPEPVTGQTLQGNLPENINTEESVKERFAVVTFEPNERIITVPNALTSEQQTRRNTLLGEIEALKRLKNRIRSIRPNSSCLFNEVRLSDKYLRGFEPIVRNVFRPVFYSQTPEDFHRRLTFLQQCVRQGNATRTSTTDAQGNVLSLSSKNSVFGRPPVCVLRIGDFFHTKIIIDQISFDYGETWDLNPEGMGMQFMTADISIQMKVIGGQSLKTAIDVLQNAESFNYYANSTFYNQGIYETATRFESEQVEVNRNINAAKKQITDARNRQSNSGTGEV